MGARQSTDHESCHNDSQVNMELGDSKLRLAKRPSMPSESELCGNSATFPSAMKRRAFSESEAVVLGERERTRLNEREIRRNKEILSWKENFNALLKHPVGYELFRLFLKEEHSEESIMFWRACEDFKRSNFRVCSKAKRLYRNYIRNESRFQVNLDYKEQIKIAEALKSPNKTIFDEAQRKIKFMMMNDAYPRFLKSSRYQNLEQRAIAD